MSGFKVDSLWVKSRQSPMDKWHLWLHFFKKGELLNLILKAVGTKALCLAVFYCIMSSGCFADTAKGN